MPTPSCWWRRTSRAGFAGASSPNSASATLISRTPCGPARSPASCALIHASNLARAQGLPAVPEEATAGPLRLLRHGVNAGLSQVRRVPGANEKQPPGRLLLECLKHREDDVLRFLSDTAIPPTNNQAERDARPAKTQQKISGRLRSETTTRHRYAIRGYASAAGKHSIAVFTAIRDALAGNPWMAPIPAPP
jgi:transposase